MKTELLENKIITVKMNVYHDFYRDRVNFLCGGSSDAMFWTLLLFLFLNENSYNNFFTVVEELTPPTEPGTFQLLMLLCQ